MTVTFACQLFGGFKDLFLNWLNLKYARYTIVAVVNVRYMVVVVTQFNVAVHDSGHEPGVDRLAVTFLLDQLQHRVRHLQLKNLTTFKVNVAMIQLAQVDHKI